MENFKKPSIYDEAIADVIKSDDFKKVVGSLKLLIENQANAHKSKKTDKYLSIITLIILMAGIGTLGYIKIIDGCSAGTLIGSIVGYFVKDLSQE
jgi:hypothetical protein